MFELSFGEMLVILAAAVVFIGPKELPAVIRGLSKCRRAVGSLTNEVRAVWQDISAEASAGELADELRQSTRLIRGDDGKLYEAYDLASLDIAQQENKVVTRNE